MTKPIITVTKIMLKPIGAEDQLFDLLEGVSEETKAAVEQKKKLLAENIRKVVSVNGSKIYEPFIEGDNIEYRLSKDGPQYYYPIRHAVIEIAADSDQLAAHTTQAAMNPEYQALLAAIKSMYASRITEADADPDKWYEFFVSEGEKEGTHTVESGDTFDEAVAEFEKYADEYGLDNVFLDLWTNKVSPKQVDGGVWSNDLFYSGLHDYFAKSGKLGKMRMIGIATYPEDGGQPTFTKDYRDENQYFADGIAFRYFRDRVCYIPEYGDEDDLTSHYTRARLVEVCSGDEHKAKLLFDHLTWESPETLLEQWEPTDGIFDEDSN